jgi:predicted RNase H-like HicB family nuclease
MIKDLEYYLALDYDIAVRELDESEGGGFVAYYIDLPFILGDGSTKDEAIKDVKSAFKAYIMSALKHNDKIIEPKDANMTKRINITLPNYLLEKIDEYAKNYHMSRSAFIQQASKKLLTR